MVRRRRMPRGLFHNQLQLPLQSLMTSASPTQLQSASPSPSAGGPQYASWLQASAPHVASNYQLLQWQQQQQQSQPLMSRLCNKMVGGCMPRLPTLPRRSLMTWQPEVIHLPHVPQVPQSVTLPHWCRATGQRQRGNVARSVESRQPAENQLKRQQQLQLWQRQQWQLQQQQQQHQQQQHQRWQQPTTVATATRKTNNNFQPFNFGICAENFFNFKKSESTLYAATNVACAKLPVSILKNPNKTSLLQGEDFSYVKVAKQMMQPATDSNNEQKNRLPVSLDKKLLSPSNEASTTTLTNTSNETLTDCCHTAKESNRKTSSAESFQVSNQINVRCSEESLNQLATDIESNLSAIRQLLELQLPQNGAKQINVQELDHLAALLQNRIGVNFKPGVHLKGGETQDPKMELDPESVETRNSSYEMCVKIATVL
ncbi:hypothetical protein ACLKA6_005430 [Drosophila palustris]